ncbi:MAG: polysaccharide biosynthesis protein, partial [Candidatus Fonsibacter sp.]
MNFLSGKNVLVTGGTGSFGKEFVRRIISENQVNKLIIFSRDELKQFELANEIQSPKL